MKRKKKNKKKKKRVIYIKNLNKYKNKMGQSIGRQKEKENEDIKKL